MLNVPLLEVVVFTETSDFGPGILVIFNSLLCAVSVLFSFLRS